MSWHACISAAKWISAKPSAWAKHDGLFVWTKGYQQSEILSASEWALLPAQITVRIIRFTATIRGFRSRRITLVTTLLDPKLYPAQELIASTPGAGDWNCACAISRRRWAWNNCAARPPTWPKRNSWPIWSAHNLIRCVMAEAVARHQVDLERVSFKGSVDALRQYSDAIAQARNRKLRRQLWEDLLLNLARDLVPTRPNRTEPRAVKRRPKPYPLLNQPRRRFKEISHRNRYWKGRPRNYRNLN